MKNGAYLGATPHLHLIRSYKLHESHLPNHSTGPTPSSTMRSGRTSTGGSLATNRQPTRANSKFQPSYGQASQLEVWEVARAATAAKFYFEPLKIEDPSGQGFITFTDAGIGLSNNPTQIAKREIENRHGPTSVGIVVSVGTARKLRENAKKKRFWSIIPDAAREFADGANDPEAVHNDMQNDHVRNNEFPYYRLNHPGGLKTELDEWEPKSRMYNKKKGGVKTIADMESAFHKWAAKPENIKELEECADDLVKCRRGRMNTSKWERYATGSHYECPYQGCDPGDLFGRDGFADHLTKKHGSGGEDLENQVSVYRKQWRYQAAPNRH